MPVAFQQQDGLSQKITDLRVVHRNGRQGKRIAIELMRALDIEL